jgi:hypothetical protein
VIDRIQDGRCRHVGTSSAGYEMGIYHRTLMKIGTQTTQNMQIECKVIKAEAYVQKNSKN